MKITEDILSLLRAHVLIILFNASLQAEWGTPSSLSYASLCFHYSLKCAWNLLVNAAPAEELLTATQQHVWMMKRLSTLRVQMILQRWESPQCIRDSASEAFWHYLCLARRTMLLVSPRSLAVDFGTFRCSAAALLLALVLRRLRNVPSNREVGDRDDKRFTALRCDFELEEKEREEGENL